MIAISQFENNKTISKALIIIGWIFAVLCLPFFVSSFYLMLFGSLAIFFGTISVFLKDKRGIKLVVAASIFMLISLCVNYFFINFLKLIINVFVILQ
jgi:hypothetical protein